MFGGALKFGDSQMKYAILQNFSFVSNRRDNWLLLPKALFWLVLILLLGTSNTPGVSFEKKIGGTGTL
jgi:hypothetical protein